MNVYKREAKNPLRRGAHVLWLFGIAAMWMISGAVAAEQPTVAAETKVTVYKTPTCGCCTKWVNHMKANGFEVEAIDMRDLRLVKSMSGVDPKNASCHTAKVGGYVIEGHVPADDINRLLKERPDIKGLAVPGMPMGSPGMEGPHKDEYDVLTINHDGSTDVFARR